MKCPSCGVRIPKNADCTSCKKWNGSGREPSDKPFGFELMLHEAIRKGSYSTLAGLLYAGSGEESFKATDKMGRTAEEYAMYLGDLKALKMLRKGRERIIAHERRLERRHRFQQKVGMAPTDEEMEAAAGMFSPGGVKKRRKVSPMEKARKFIICGVFIAISAVVLFFVSQPAGMAVGGFFIVFGMIAGVRTMVYQGMAWPWFVSGLVIFLMMMGTMMMQSQKILDEARNKTSAEFAAVRKNASIPAKAKPVKKIPLDKDAPIPAKKSTPAAAKKQVDPQLEQEIAQVRKLMKERKITDAQAALIKLLTAHPDDPNVKQLAKDLEVLRKYSE